MAWQQDPTGYVHGPYRVVLEGPRRWRLSRQGHSIAMFESLSAAKSAAEQVERRRRKRQAAAIWLAVSLLAAAAVVLVAAFPKVPNPDYPPAEALAEHLRSAYRSIQAGEAVPGQYQVGTDGFEGGVVLRPGTDREYNVLMGKSGGECYVIWWDDGYLPQGGVLVKSLDCRPSTVIFSVGNNYERFSPAADRRLLNVTGTDIVSEQILPSPTRFGWWVVPGIAVGLLVSMMALVRMVVVLIRRQA